MINCLIVDDEPYAVELLCRHIAEYDNLHITSTCGNIKEAVAVLNKEGVDLMFLDVRMPEVSGIEFLKNSINTPDIILTTAYRDYAVQAYEFGVIDYLVKPISFMRFAKSIDRYKELKKGLSENEHNNSIIFKSGYEYHKVNPADIIYIKSAKEYVEIVLPDNKLTVRSNMEDVLLKLPDEMFIQAHKSYIVPLRKIVSVSNEEVILAGDIKVPLGRTFLKNVRKSFSK